MLTEITSVLSNSSMASLVTQRNRKGILTMAYKQSGYVLASLAQFILCLLSLYQQYHLLHSQNVLVYMIRLNCHLHYKICDVVSHLFLCFHFVLLFLVHSISGTVASQIHQKNQHDPYSGVCNCQSFFREALDLCICIALLLCSFRYLLKCYQKSFHARCQLLVLRGMADIYVLYCVARAGSQSPFLVEMQLWSTK